MFRKLALRSAVSLGVCGSAASAQEAPKPFYIHLGPGDVILDEGAKLSVGGQVIPGIPWPTSCADWKKPGCSPRG